MAEKSNVVNLRDDFLREDFNAAKTFSPAKWPETGAPPIDWLVEGCFIKGTVALLSSDGGLGKSLLMQQLQTACSLGQPWLGFPTTRVNSWAMYCEDPEDELRRRQQRINRHYDCHMGDLEGMYLRSRIGQYNIMAEFPKWSALPSPTNLFYASMTKAHDCGAQLIILDTVSDIFGGSEIARDQVRAFITLMTRWAIQAEGCVILTAHVSNEGLATGSGLAGSRAWSNSVRSRLWLADGKKDETGNLRQLRGMKQNWGARGKPISLTWSDGVFKRVDPPATRDFSEPTFAQDWPG